MSVSHCVAFGTWCPRGRQCSIRSKKCQTSFPSLFLTLSSWSQPKLFFVIIGGGKYYESYLYTVRTFSRFVQISCERRADFDLPCQFAPGLRVHWRKTLIVRCLQLFLREPQVSHRIIIYLDKFGRYFSTSASDCWTWMRNRFSFGSLPPWPTITGEVEIIWYYIF